MADRLSWFRAQPRSWLHWEPLSGGIQAHQALVKRLPGATCHVVASQWTPIRQALAEPGAAWWNPSRWGRASGPARATPDTQVDMVWANMHLHLEPRPQALLRQWNHHVAVDGFLMFSCLGPDSLRELRSVYEQAGWPAPAHAFTDMHDWGDMLVHNGFAEPVTDMERIVLTYSTADALLAELRQLGRNLAAERFAGLRGRTWHARLREMIESGLPRSPDGRLQLTFEIVYGHAFKPQPRKPAAGQSNVSLDAMRAMLRGPRR